MSMFLNLKTKSPAVSPEIAKIELTELRDEADVIDAANQMNKLGLSNSELVVYEVDGDDIAGYEVDEFLANAIR